MSLQNMPDAIPGLLNEIGVTLVLGEDSMPNPADLARLRAVSHTMRNAVAETGRQVKNPSPPDSFAMVKVVDDFANMGFTREQVVGVIRELQEGGRDVDLNQVLDRLTIPQEGSGSGTSSYEQIHLYYSTAARDGDAGERRNMTTSTHYSTQCYN